MTSQKARKSVLTFYRRNMRKKVKTWQEGHRRAQGDL